MKNIEKLIEALSCNDLEENKWWEILGSVQEARRILSEVLKEEIDEYEVASIADYLDINTYDDILRNTLKFCIKELKKELIITE